MNELMKALHFAEDSPAIEPEAYDYSKNIEFNLMHVHGLCLHLLSEIKLIKKDIKRLEKDIYRLDLGDNDELQNKTSRFFFKF